MTDEPRQPPEVPERDEGEIPQEHVGRQPQAGVSSVRQRLASSSTSSISGSKIVRLCTDKVAVEMQALPLLVGDEAVILNARLRAHERKDVSERAVAIEVAPRGRRRSWARWRRRRRSWVRRIS